MKQLALFNTFQRHIPYNDLPPLPPATALETIRTLKAAIPANTALAELRGVGDLIPNQSMLIRAILLQEARLSSEVENIVTTNDAMYRALGDDGKSTDPSTKEVIRYGEALWHGYTALQSGRPLSAGMYVELVQVIKKVELGIRTLPGCQVVNQATREPVYTPPEGEAQIRCLLDNLSEYIYATDGLDPLIKMAVVHYQFEAIHPFPDGNGRTGRVLNLLFLLEKQLLSLPVLYLSRFIIEHKPDYYAALRAVTESAAWEEWIIYMLQAVEHTALFTRDMIRQIRVALDEAVILARDNMGRAYSKELVELVFAQPYTRIASVVSAGLAKRQTASEHLRELERIGLLRGIKIGSEMLYLNTRLMGILTA